jgi:uncharacterized membrane protein (UPF0127 family)
MQVEMRAAVAQVGPVRKSLVLAVFIATTALGAGCKKAADANAGAVAEPGLPTTAQPTLRTAKLWLGPEEMTAELALTPEQERTGMMFRTNLDENAGMLFALPYTQRASFWMKNCPLPLSAAYIDPEGVIVEVHDLQPFDTNAVTAASDSIRFVLETRQGWFLRHHLGAGATVRMENGPLLQIFFGQR